ncbi:hypothetical protein H5410_055700 [Solanum commersonii]|uniref:Histone chaperone domain-containing protein n=1 Tax=Solanum commersonii TaxID=4109 RepID=A0A9J5WL01_SOLCO|nr:hypothetical protein H5410_055700 [Solanum commersonii]
MRRARLRLLRHVKRHVRIGGDRPNKYSREVIWQDMTHLLFTEDMTLDKKVWRLRSRVEEIKEVKKRKQTAKELEGIDLSNIVSNTRRRSTTSFLVPPRPKSPPKNDKNDDKDGDSDADDASDDDKDDDNNEDDESSQSDEEFNEGGDNLHVCAGSSALKGFLALGESQQ